MQYTTVILNSSHKKQHFNCGKLFLDNYIQFQAKQDIKRKLSVCFVIADHHNVVKGYFTLSSFSIPKEIIPEKIRAKLPSYRNMPVTLLGGLAVDINHKGQGLGEFLLVDALKQSWDASHSIGSIAVIVEPTDDEAVRFYHKYGFILLPESGKMFLPMATIATLFNHKATSHR